VGNRGNQSEGYLFGPDAWEEPEFPDEPPPIS